MASTPPSSENSEHSSSGRNRRSGSVRASLRKIPRLRKELSEARKKLAAQGRLLEGLEEELGHEREHSATLERLLDEAYDRLEEAGLTDPLGFPVSQEARRLFDAVDWPASFEGVMQVACQELKCSSGEAGGLLGELTSEGVVAAASDESETARKKPAGETWYVETGHRPFF